MDRDRITIRGAAPLNKGTPQTTVRNRLKAGMYTGEKVATERGETWMIDLTV